jgi:uncharacterized protein YbaR (Trm112 family)
MASDDGPLACPRCATHYPLSERFCPTCEMPLVYVGSAEQKPITDAHGRARKVKPQFTRGDLVRVAGSRNQAEAELIQGLLLEEGIPSLLRRTRGFDVPDFLAAGPRDVLVPESAVDEARSLLEVESPSGDANGGVGPSVTGARAGPAPAMLLAGILIALVAGSGLLALLYALGD